MLIRPILNTSTYTVHQHRKVDLCECFERILLEDGDGSCQRLVNDICAEFPILEVKGTGGPQSLNLC